MKKLIGAACVAAAFAGLSGAASAQSWPGKTMTIYVATAPGGPLDLIARLIGSHIERKYKTSVVVENRTGAGGVVAGTALVRAPADGYSFGTGMNISTDVFIKDMPYKTSEIQPVVLVGQSAYALIVSPNTNSKTLAEFLAFAKANPGKVQFGAVPSSSHETESHEAMASLGIQGSVIGYKGIAPIYTALASGNEVHAVLGSGSPMVKAGKIFAIAIGGERRSPDLPDTPTFKELGVAYNPVANYAFFTRAGTPKDLLDRFAAEGAEVAKSAEFAEKITKSFNIYAMGLNVEQTTKVITEEDQKVRRAAQRAGIRPQ